MVHSLDALLGVALGLHKYCSLSISTLLRGRLPSIGSIIFSEKNYDLLTHPKNWDHVTFNFRHHPNSMRKKIKNCVGSSMLLQLPCQDLDEVAALSNVTEADVARNG